MSFGFKRATTFQQKKLEFFWFVWKLVGHLKGDVCPTFQYLSFYCSWDMNKYEWTSTFLFFEKSFEFVCFSQRLARFRPKKEKQVMAFWIHLTTDKRTKRWTRVWETNECLKRPLTVNFNKQKPSLAKLTSRRKPHTEKQNPEMKTNITLLPQHQKKSLLPNVDGIFPWAFDEVKRLCLTHVSQLKMR